MDIAKDGLSFVQVPHNLRQKVLTERRKVSSIQWAVASYSFTLYTE